MTLAGGVRLSRFVRYRLPLVLWLALMVFLSGSEGSFAVSLKIVKAVLLFLFPHVTPKTIALVHLISRKLAHIMEYGVFTVLLFRAFWAGQSDGRRRQWLFWAGLLALLMASLDETVQSFIPSRTGSPWHVAVDGLGILLGLWVIRWLSKPATEQRH